MFVAARQVATFWWLGTATVVIGGIFLAADLSGAGAASTQLTLPSNPALQQHLIFAWLATPMPDTCASALAMQRYIKVRVSNIIARQSVHSASLALLGQWSEGVAQA